MNHRKLNELKSNKRQNDNQLHATPAGFEPALTNETDIKK